MFIAAVSKEGITDGIRMDQEKVTELRNSVSMTVMKYRLWTKPRYRLIYAYNRHVLILIDIYPKNEQEKIPIPLINAHMANVPKDCNDLKEPFIELPDRSCKGLIRSG